MDNIRNKVIKSIQDEWETISYYNDLIDDLEADGDTDGVNVIDDINKEEHTHVGQLQSLLQTMGGDLDAIEEGEEEGEEQLEESFEDNKMENDFEKQINEFIEESRGYTDYDGIVQGVADEFDLPKEDAEQYVWNYMYTIGHDVNSMYDESLNEDYVPKAINDAITQTKKFLAHTYYKVPPIEHYGKNDHFSFTVSKDNHIFSTSALKKHLKKNGIEVSVSRFSHPQLTGGNVEFTVYLKSPAYNESLNESLIDPTQEDIEEFEEIVDYNDFDIEKKGKTLFGNIHYQIIDRQGAEINSQEALRERIEDFIKDIDKFEEDYNIPVTWNFGVNDEGILTAGIDLREKYVEDNIDESLKESYVPVTLDRVKDAPYAEDIYSTNPHGIVRIKTDHGYKIYTKRKKNYWVRTTGSMRGYEEFNDQQIFDLVKNNKNAEIWVESANESLKESRTTFNSNEDWVNYLTKKLDLDTYEVEMLEHDLNNLRAYEWIDYMKSKKVPKDVVNKFVQFFGLNEELHNDYEVNPEAVNDYEVDDDANNDYLYIDESLKEAFDNGNDPHKNIDLGYIKGTHWSVSIYDKTGTIYLNQHHPYDDAEYCWAYSTDKGKTFIIIRDRKKLETFKADPKEKYQDIIARMSYLDKNTKSRMLYNSLDTRSHRSLQEKQYKMTNKKIKESIEPEETSCEFVVYPLFNGEDYDPNENTTMSYSSAFTKERAIKNAKELLDEYENITGVVVVLRPDYEYEEDEKEFIQAIKDRYGYYPNQVVWDSRHFDKLTNKEIKEALNKLDMWAIDNDTTFHDLKTLYEAFVNPNSPVDQKKKEKIQKALNDPTLNKDKEKLQDYIAGVLSRKEESLEETLEDDDEFDEFTSQHPEYNKKFDKKRFGKFFDKNGKLIPEKKRDFWQEYDKGTIKEGFNPDSEDDINILYDIADRYCSSYPVSGRWDDETEHELQDIMDTFDVSRIKAIQIMQDFLGFEDEQLYDVE